MTEVRGIKGKMIEGTTPGATWVRDMFGRIAPRYDLLNHLLSMNIDKHWRARTVRRVADVLERPGAKVLDLCCGTGDLTLALAAGKATVLGSDFCHPMLVAAQKKASASKLFEADALQIPVADGSLDLVTMAFAFRNLASYRRRLEELRRVLKPGGMAAILEFSTPPNRALASVYGFYSRAILPKIGGMILGAKEAYTYLPESVRRFPNAPELAEEMREAGFGDVRFERMTFGVVALHLGNRL